MTLVIDQLLLLAATAALGAAGWRLAGQAVESGLLRVLGAVALAAGAAVLCALGLGLVALGASPVALTAAAVVLWLLTRRAVPAPQPGAGEQITAWWRALPVAGRAARLAAAGALAGYAVWVLRYPVLGLDALTYHLGLPVAWVHNGRPGSLVVVDDGLPLQNYPLTWEVLVTWVTGIGRTLVPATLVTPASLALLGASVRAGLGEMDVPGRLAWLAALAVVTLPIGVVQLSGPNTDVPEAAWLACAVALIAGAVRRRAAGERRPGLIAVALVAIGLCVGTKTTGAPLAALALVLGAWACRRELGRVARPLALAAVAAAFVGGVWYVRNLIIHGAPFWPLSTTPWGDPIPPAFRAVDASLLSNFHATLHGRTDAYWRAVAGGVVLVAGAVACALWATRKAARWGAVVVPGALVIWAASPYTGMAANTQLAVGATRYLLPCLTAGAVAVALAARRPPGGGTLGVRAAAAEALSGLVLLGALGVNLYRDRALGFPNAPGTRLVLEAVVAGAALALLLEGLVRAARAGPALARWGATLLLAATPVAALVTLLVPVDGYVTAHASTRLFDAGVLDWLHSRSAYREGDAPVFIGPAMDAVLTGPRLAHPVRVLAGQESCPALTAAASRGWIVISLDPSTLAYARRLILCLPGRRPAYYDTSFLVYAPAALARAS